MPNKPTARPRAAPKSTPESVSRPTNLLRLLAVLLAGLITSPAAGDEIVIDDFATGLAAGWTVESFVGSTEYKVSRDNDQPCLRATSANSASGLYYRLSYDPRRYPIIDWSWKIDNVLARGNALHKAGDDYAARLYVVFPSLLFWRTRTLTYIWANKIPKGTAVPSPYTDNAMMIAVESGPGLTGVWLNETRNIHEDYKKYFGGEPGEVGAIAIMTDTDNTGGRASACYGPIRIRSAEHGQNPFDLPDR